MTNEQWYWQRRQQVLRAYAQKQLAGSSNGRVKVLRPNLKEIWPDEFVEDYQIVPDSGPAAALRKGTSCSSVRKGNFHGRNFDFTYDTGTTYIVHVKHTDKYNAFTGVAKATFGTVQPQIEKVPNLMKDGINEHGVTVNINVVSMQDLVDCGLANNETLPGMPRVHMDCVPAYVLAHATSAVDAVKRMQSEISIYGDLAGEEYIHFMISDMKDTFTVEVIGSQLYVIGYSMNDPADNDIVGARPAREGELPIMTNWYLNYDKLPEIAICADGKYTYHGCGIERYNVLSAGYESAGSMLELMKTARYTNEILKDVSADNYPFSDACGMSIYGLSAYNAIPQFKEFIDGDRAKMKLALETGDRTKGIWITSHNSNYDIASKSFTFVFEEDYDHPMTFSL